MEKILKDLCRSCKTSNSKDCVEFKKQKVSNFDYIVFLQKDLYENDFAGFCSAGILLVDDFGNFLAVKEQRDGQLLYNLIGGKRDTYEETPLKTATREFEEETGVILNNVLIKSYTWFSFSKYVIVEAYVRKDINLGDNFKWFSIKNYNKNDFHPFAAKMLSSHENLKESIFY